MKCKVFCKYLHLCAGMSFFYTERCLYPTHTSVPSSRLDCLRSFDSFKSLHSCCTVIHIVYMIIDYLIGWLTYFKCCSCWMYCIYTWVLDSVEYYVLYKDFLYKPNVSCSHTIPIEYKLKISPLINFSGWLFVDLLSFKNKRKINFWTLFRM